MYGKIEAYEEGGGTYSNNMAYHSRQESTIMIRPPIHPVAQLQGAFEESMLESVIDDTDMDVFLDPTARRNILLGAPAYTRVVAGRWKQKPSEKFHPLWKLIAQISFGIHLLAQRMANSEDEVMQILQSHVDEIDGFLERATEDFNLAQEDIQERLRCLKLPLSHPATFDKMLEDRSFRLSIVEGNEKIEHVVDRTSQAMKDSLKDVQKGFDSTSCLEGYLQALEQTWIRQSAEHEAVFVAMLGNVEGWRKAFMSLHVQGSKLGGSLKKLRDIINEMQKRAGEVSRRLLHQARGFPNVPHSRLQQHQAMRNATGLNMPTSRFAPNKELPDMPNRPQLRQVASHDSFRTGSFTRVSSNRGLQQPDILSRSFISQQRPSSSRHTSTSPSVVHSQPGQSRVPSMVPSLLGTRPSSQTTPTISESDTANEGEESERYFPPVELPAYVPEENMSTPSMTKQRQPSVGSNLASTNRASHRGPKVGSPRSPLVELDGSVPVPNQSPTILPTSQPTRLSGGSRRAPAIESLHEAKDNSTMNKAAHSAAAPAPQHVPRKSSGTDDPVIAAYTKNNVRRPKEGTKHWFDAIDDDSVDSDKMSVQEKASPQIATLTIHTPKEPLSDHGSMPGTPSWAVTKFLKTDDRRAELKQGAFSSHPPQLPLASPPQVQHPESNPLAVATPRTRQSHGSSTGTLGESGPESNSGRSSMRRLAVIDNSASKRTSHVAPEVISVQRSASVPVTTRQFVAEMEGSMPPIVGPVADRTAVVMELEAPQQYFKLPPRPQKAPPKPPSVPEAEKEPIKEPVEASIVPPHKPLIDEKHSSGSGEAGNLELDTIAAEQDEDQPSIQQEEYEHQDIEAVSAAEATNIEEPQFLLPATTYIPTPQIPLPPSPLVTESPQKSVVDDHPHEEKQASAEPLYLLPAVAYKASVSPTISQQPPTPIPPPIETPPLPPSTETKALAPSTTSTQSQPPESGFVDSVSNAALHEVERFMQQDQVSEDLSQFGNTSSHSNHNEWKAFFTGKPSPVGSNLSIRSIKRESAEDLPLISSKSPTLLSSMSAMKRSPFQSISEADSPESVVWFDTACGEQKSSNKVIEREQAKSQASPLGLGIQSVGLQ